LIRLKRNANFQAPDLSHVWVASIAIHLTLFGFNAKLGLDPGRSSLVTYPIQLFQLSGSFAVESDSFRSGFSSASGAWKSAFDADDRFLWTITETIFAGIIGNLAKQERSVV